MADYSPMMQQYRETKEKHPDEILLFRLGDFYEMFFEDAELVSKELDLVLTGRNCGQDERAPMCGVPYHSAENYIARLVAKGYKVAICEQMEDPAAVKGLVKRDVVRVITPGTIIEETMLEESANNYLACVYKAENRAGICFSDVSTGEVHLTVVQGENLDGKIAAELSSFQPKEVLMNGEAAHSPELKEHLNQKMDCTLEILKDDFFQPDVCKETVEKHFNEENLSKLSLEEAAIVLGVSLEYLWHTQRQNLSNIREVDYYQDSQFMRLDSNARRNLELCETMRGKEKKGSLLWVLDKTSCAMGKRLIRQWLEQPLLNCLQIEKRLNAVEELVENTILRQEEMETLRKIHDLERIMTRIIYNSATPRELKSLSYTICQIANLKKELEPCASQLLRDIWEEMDLLQDIQHLIDTAIVDEPPASMKDGGVIQDGYHEEIDSLREIIKGGKGYLANIQQQEQERTGIKKLKIGYNRVFGYYIEVSNSFKDQVPEEYIRKQTLTNCERFITQELKELEGRILGANERVVSLEQELYEDIRRKISVELHRVQKTAQAIARLDVLCSFAQVSASNQFARPEVNMGQAISIEEGRHPVVEQLSKGFPFVPNDTYLDEKEDRIAIITGPNMAGKSTYMRQIALICLMAQVGCFVPATAATVGIVDSIFTRVGASDDLASGKSTFMVEMNEVADILKDATSNSLIILDEIGRGTSTFDGMSIARAVIEYIADPKRLGAKTLFATHYHELTELEGQIDGVKNYNIAVKKRGDDITFLRRIVRGGADESYGIEVAKLAGIPEKVVERAKMVLKTLEGVQNSIDTLPRKPGKKKTEEPPQLSMEQSRQSAVLDKLKTVDVETLTPIEALSLLYEMNTELNQK